LTRAAAALLLCGAALAHDVPHPRRELLRLSPAGVRLIVDYVLHGAAGGARRALGAVASAKKNFFFALFSPRLARRVELGDKDPSGHVPVTAECEQCKITAASSGIADGNLVRGANTPLRLTVKL
jgi:hypothetical protein